MNFDEDINRNNTNCLKYDFKFERNKPDDVFPMWVADMDFKCSNEILKDLHDKINHGIFGYSKNDTNYFNAIKNWYINNFDTNLEEDWLVPTPGVVFALATSVKTLTNENDYILINRPVYYPFTEVIEDNNRHVISSDLILEDNHYKIDFNDLETKIKKYKVKLYLLCSPHNPVGRVWTQEEINSIIDICKRNNVYIVSDEIHSDFIWRGNHNCILKNNDYKDNIILCTAPTKTFNLAGLQASNIFIPNKDIRKKFELELSKTGYSTLNTMALVASTSAYLKGSNWLNELKKYLRNNIDYVDIFLKRNLPKVNLIYPEGTYLLWLDFRKLNLSDNDINNLMINEAKLWLDNGKMFGSSGEGFQRINIALPKKKLELALNNIEKTFNKY